MKLKKAKFFIENPEIAVYEGYTFDKTTWNGFEKPYFTKEVAVKILEDHLISLDSSWKFNESNLSIIVKTGEQEIVYELQHIQELELYPIGNGHWCWERLK